MASIVLGYRDRIKAGSVTAGSARANLPAANLQSPQPGQLWRSLAGVNATSLLCDLGAQTALRAIYLGNTNLTEAATWRVRLSTADATGAAGDAYDSGTVAAGADTLYRLALLVLAADATGRHLRLDLSDASLDSLEAGRWWAGSVFQPQRNYRFGMQRLARDYSRIGKGGDGQDWVERGALQRGVALTLPLVGGSEWRAGGEPFTRYATGGEDVLVCLDPGSDHPGEQTFFGLAEQPPAWELIAHDRLSTKLTVWHRL